MTDIEVRIEELPSMRVATALGYGEAPEIEAWNTLLSWARRQGLVGELHEHRFFGFNHPGPGSGSPNYGYEQWMTVGPGAAASDDIEIKDFPGGMYAVTRCRFEHLVKTWQEFVAWREDSRYQYADDHCLEEVLTPWMLAAHSAGEPVNLDDAIFVLYLPVIE